MLSTLTHVSYVAFSVCESLVWGELGARNCIKSEWIDRIWMGSEWLLAFSPFLPFIQFLPLPIGFLSFTLFVSVWLHLAFSCLLPHFPHSLPVRIGQGESGSVTEVICWSRGQNQLREMEERMWSRVRTEGKKRGGWCRNESHIKVTSGRLLFEIFCHFWMFSD